MLNIPVSHRHGRWEILPQKAKTGEVILSKRTQLGVFSNLSFIYENIIYNSIEGLWQVMKYPDPTDINDLRNNFSADYPYTRSEATSEKVNQSNQLIDLLLKTKGIKLRPDHFQSKISLSSFLTKNIA